MDQLASQSHQHRPSVLRVPGKLAPNELAGARDGVPFFVQQKPKPEEYLQVRPGVPAMTGAYMFFTGKWGGTGVKNVEEFNPDPFLDKLAKSGLPWNEINKTTVSRINVHCEGVTN